MIGAKSRYFNYGGTGRIFQRSEPGILGSFWLIEGKKNVFAILDDVFS